ncbi:MAG: hypothetical protein IKF00_05575 [Solobacterium sp.]|nr:hypothetical protein [Solobacterium sp.]
MKIGDRVYVHGFVDEIRKDCVIIHNDGGYFGTVKSEIVEAQKTEDIVSVTRCKDCKRWNRNDGMFKDFDEREWHHCPHLGIDTDGYFSCIEGERKDE